jgi:hypothetical protein
VLFTDYAALSRHARRPGVVEVVTDAAGRELSALWLTTAFRQWRELPRGLLVNQFPFEGALVCKDLLAATAKRIHACGARAPHSGDDGAAAPAHAALAAAFPPWCPVTFDLATEAHLCGAFHASHAAAHGGHPPVWIVKLAGGTRSSDPAVTADLACVMRYALHAPGGDRVAQLYEPRPLLLAGGRKFDVRVYVAVRDFAPLDAAVHCGYYGRVAAAPFAGAADVSAPGLDVAAHFTVSWYGDGPQSTLLDARALAAAAAAEGVDWAAQAHPAIVAALRQLFAGAGEHFVGHWPQSRGLYGVDVLLAWRDGDGVCSPGGDDDAVVAPGARYLQPLVLEVNFSGDLETILERLPTAARTAGSSDGVDAAAAAAAQPAAPAFVDDMLGYLFAGAAVPSGWEGLQLQDT